MKRFDWQVLKQVARDLVDRVKQGKYVNRGGLENQFEQLHL